MGSQRTYRSMQADALALPWFTYGLDIVLLVGRLRLSEHQTVDEIHQEVLKRLAPLGVKMARREVLYLFEAYCTLLRASSEAKDDVEWLAQVEKNGGIIVSVDGIQEDAGNETVAPFARCAHGAGAGSPERDVVGDRRDEGPACASSRVRGEGARHDHRRHRSVNCWQSRNCGRMCRTRCASSTRCAMPRKRPSRPTSRSKRPCANACNPRSERCANRSRSTWPRPRPMKPSSSQCSMITPPGL